MKKRKLIFLLKISAILDILFYRHWELKAKNEYGRENITRFDKDEILNSKI